MYDLYCISGISGSGKTTIGRRIVELGVIPNAIFVDEDDYYLPTKPSVTLSTGLRVRNWDSLEAIDPKFKESIGKKLEVSPVVLVGFALTADILPVQPKFHIHLVTADTPEDLEARCKFARIQAKPKINPVMDALVVKEVVIPFYHKTIRNSEISHLIFVFDKNGARISVNELITQVRNIYTVADSTARCNFHTMQVAEPYFSLIRSGTKSVEGRKISPAWIKIRRGDTISMTCKGKEPFSVMVIHVVMYLPSIGDPLTEYLKTETLARTLPGVNSIEEGRKVYLQWSSEAEIKGMGMMGIEVKVL